MNGITNELERLAVLRAKGLITVKEFEQWAFRIRRQDYVSLSKTTFWFGEESLISVLEGYASSRLEELAELRDKGHLTVEEFEDWANVLQSGIEAALNPPDMRGQREGRGPPPGYHSDGPSWVDWINLTDEQLAKLIKSTLR